MTATFDLSNRVALVTGASSGLGAGFAKKLAQSGARVVLAARRSDKLQSLAKEIGDQALAISMDVSNEASVINGYDQAEAHFGLINTVIANAGIDGNGRAVDIDIETFNQTLQINLTGSFITAREGARRMIKAHKGSDWDAGRVLLISSITSHLSSPGLGAYPASKAGVSQLATMLAREWANRGINVNAIAPGYIQTDINADWFETEAGKKQISSFPRRRLMPQEGLDEMMLYLCSDASRYITGAQLTMDDGQTL